jgi:hypothetical protein
MIITHGRHALSCVFYCLRNITESFNFAWCASETALGMTFMAGNQVSMTGSYTIRVFATVLLTGQRKHPCAERTHTRAQEQMEEEDTSVIAMAETAIRRLDPPILKTVGWLLSGYFDHHRSLSATRCPACNDCRSARDESGNRYRLFIELGTGSFMALSGSGENTVTSFGRAYSRD